MVKHRKKFLDILAHEEDGLAAGEHSDTCGSGQHEANLQKFQQIEEEWFVQENSLEHAKNVLADMVAAWEKSNLFISEREVKPVILE
jgi:hypothetical protein